MKTICTMYISLFGCLLVSCSKENPLNPAGACYGDNWSAQYANELQAWSNAAQEYANDPTAANCAEYKDAAKDYLNALNDVYDCVPTVHRKQVDEAIKEAKANIDAEDCN